ncbi:MAG: hypothetical protein V1899_03460 [Planctomycetota bacterium]
MNFCTILIFISCFLIGTPVVFGGEMASTEELLRQLFALRGKEYIAARDELLTHKDIVASIAVIRKGAKDWRFLILLDALSYRVHNSELAPLVDYYLAPNPFKTRLGTSGGSRISPIVVIICCGQEGFPIIAEGLFF